MRADHAAPRSRAPKLDAAARFIGNEVQRARGSNSSPSPGPTRSVSRALFKSPPAVLARSVASAHTPVASRRSRRTPSSSSRRAGWSTGAFAELLGIDPSTASRNLAGLVRAGLITRRASTEDGRQSELRLTPKGKRKAEALATDTVRAVTLLLDRVPRADRQRVIDALDVVAAAVLAAEARS